MHSAALMRYALTAAGKQYFGAVGYIQMVVVTRGLILQGD